MNSARFLGGCTIVWVAATDAGGPLPFAGGVENVPNVRRVRRPDRAGRPHLRHERTVRSAAIPFSSSLGTNGRARASIAISRRMRWAMTPAHLRKIGSRRPAVATPSSGPTTDRIRRSRTCRRSRRGGRRHSMLLDQGSDSRRHRRCRRPRSSSSRTSTTPTGTPPRTEPSLSWRPLLSTNLNFLATVMWDGRETFAGQTMHFDLSDQAERRQRLDPRRQHQSADRRRRGDRLRAGPHRPDRGPRGRQPARGRRARRPGSGRCRRSPSSSASTTCSGRRSTRACSRCSTPGRT